MKFDLTNSPFLNVSQLGDLVSQLDALHTRTLRVIERLQKDVAARKAEIAGRWQRMDAISPGDRQRLTEQETSKAFVEIKANAQKEVDGLLKEAGRLHAQIIDQKPYYTNRAAVLNRAGLGTDRRAAFEQAAAKARPASLAGMMQFAIGTNNLEMAAACIQENDNRPESQRAFGSNDAVALLKLDDFDKASEYLKIANVRLQGIVLAVRAWTTGKSNPLNTVSMAMRMRQVDLGVLDDGGDDGDDE